MTTPSAEATMFSDATQMAGSGEVMIELVGVQKYFGKFQALRDIDLKVARREVVVVIGPSGSGKSTMIRCINRLEVHDAGRIVVDGVELSQDIRNIQEIRRETGMVFQSFNLFPHLSVLDNVTLAPAAGAQDPEGARPSSRRWRCSSRCASPTRRRNTQASCRAVSSSGWRSLARWR